MLSFQTRLRLAFIVGAGAWSVANAAEATEPFANAAPIDEQALQDAAGQADLNQVTLANQAASVSGNSVQGTTTTGAVTIDGNAFQNMSGLSVLNANSGNNVAINAAMNVNISIMQPR